MTSVAEVDTVDAILGSIHGGTALTVAEEIDLPIEAFSFDSEFQTKVAAHAVRDSKFVRRTEGLIDPDHFENASQAILVSLAQEHFKKYHNVPIGVATWGEVIKTAKKSNRIREELLPEFIETIKILFREPLTDGDFVVDKVSEFARHQAIERASFKMMTLMEKGKIDEAQKIMQVAFATGANSDFEGADFWNSIDNRTNYRSDVASGAIKPDGIPTGIKKFDNLLYHKGWGRREMSVLMAGAKRGKSMGLAEFAIRACLQGFNVLYVSLEVSKRIIMDRMDANISDTLINNLEAEAQSVNDKLKMKSGTAGVGALHITEFGSGTLSPSGLRRVVERYRGEGCSFDLICVDYADIMAPDNRTNDPIENSKSVWLGLRSIAFEENCAMLTATQTNREGFKSSVAKAEHVAEDFNKIRIADIVISVNLDDEEKSKGEARLYFAASRNGMGEFTLSIKQNLAKGKFLTGVMGIS